MNIVSRLVIGSAITVAALGAVSGSASAGGSGTVYDIATGGGQQRAEGCWEAECGGSVKPFKLILPLCYAHELSHLVPQCQGD